MAITYKYKQKKYLQIESNVFHRAMLFFIHKNTYNTYTIFSYKGSLDIVCVLL